jgi:hypothetical protein
MSAVLFYCIFIVTARAGKENGWTCHLLSGIGEEKKRRFTETCGTGVLHEFDAYRSFAALRMTRSYVVVILNGAKDLYISFTAGAE